MEIISGMEDPELSIAGIVEMEQEGSKLDQNKHMKEKEKRVLKRPFTTPVLVQWYHIRCPWVSTICIQGQNKL